MIFPDIASIKMTLISSISELNVFMLLFLTI
jgi:hypothetical protein